MATGVFFIGKHNGNVDVWDLMDRSVSIEETVKFYHPSSITYSNVKPHGMAVNCLCIMHEYGFAKENYKVDM